MDTSRVLFLLSAVGAANYCLAQAGRQDLGERLEKMSGAEIRLLAQSLVDQGSPTEGQQVTLYDLVRTRESIALPIIEQKIEQALKSPDPRDCFSNKNRHPEDTILYLWATMAQAGDRQALVEAGKLLKLDEKRFDRMVNNIMAAAIGENRGFMVAYEGFDLGDPAIEKRILPVMQEVLEKEVPYVGNPDFQRRDTSPPKEWAESLVERYDGVPTEAQWKSDPLVSRLRPEIPRALHDQVLRFAIDAAQKRVRK